MSASEAPTDPLGAIDADRRATFAAVADHLIPAAHGMPSAGDVVDDARLRFVLGARPDLVEPLRAALRPELGDDPAARLAALERDEPDRHGALLLAVVGGYYTDADVRERLGYPGQVAKQIYSWKYPTYLDEGLTDQVARPRPDLARPGDGAPGRASPEPAPRTSRRHRDGRTRLDDMARSVPRGLAAGHRATPLEDREPATGIHLLTIPGSTPDDVARAAAAAAAAQPAWAETSYQERARILRRAADIYEAHREEFGTWTHARDRGRPLQDAPRAELRLPGAAQRGDDAVAALRLAHADGPEGSPVDGPPGPGRGRRRDHAVELADGPRHAGRRAGPRARQRRRPQARPADARRRRRDLRRGLRARRACPTASSRSSSAGPTSARRIVTDPHVSLVSFTGSTAAGRRVGQLAGGLLKKVSLELGGNNAFVVLDDADLDAAAVGRARSRRSSSRARSASRPAGTSSTAASPRHTSTR